MRQTMPNVVLWCIRNMICNMGVQTEELAKIVVGSSPIYRTRAKPQMQKGIWGFFFSRTDKTV